MNCHIRDVIQNIGNLENQRKISTVFSKLDRNSSEKSIHRLLTLGIVSDYTINYSNNEYTIDFSYIIEQHYFYLHKSNFIVIFFTIFFVRFERWLRTPHSIKITAIRCNCQGF